MRHELDQDFNDLRTLLSSMDDDVPTLPVPESANDEGVMDYDKQVRELAFDKRAKPKDRTKTEEELALEQKDALEKAEKQRRMRMLGQDPGESDDEDAGGRRRKRPRGGDDLDDDFVADEPSGELGAGLGMELGSASDEEDTNGETDFGDDDQSGSDEASDEEEARRRVLRSPGTAKAVKELPYTFPAPESHDEFLEIVQDLPDSDIPIVIQRIRTLYHHTLAPENKLKLQVVSEFKVPSSLP